jgi:hypothetical protein
MFLPPDPNFYRDLPKVLASLPESTLTRAERQRLEARTAQYKARRLHCQALCWVGRRLIHWGIILLNHYGALEESRSLSQAS